jgi:CubicO group peptidase (beta-lactamase class C family)
VGSSLTACERRASATASKAGERFEYSNAGYIVLGLIVEKVSGESYADYVPSASTTGSRW